VAGRLSGRVGQPYLYTPSWPGTVADFATDYVWQSRHRMSGTYVTARAARELATRLSARDFAVLARVADLRFVRGDQLTRLHFATEDDAAASARTARRSLLRLVRLGVLERLPRPIGGVRAGSAGFVYYLGSGGQRLATDRGWQPERRRRRSFVPGTLFLHHALMVAELHAQLVEADRSRRFELLELAAEPSCWRTFGVAVGQSPALKPDSYVRLGVGAYEDSYFFEVDRGTEGSRALDRQLALYVAYHDSGREQAERQVFPKVLWLTTTAERVEVIESCVRRLPEHTHMLFTVALFDAGIEQLTASG
jgi:hypothetical protein